MKIPNPRRLEAEERLNNDLNNIDTLALQGAEMLYELEWDIRDGTFNPETFVDQVDKKFHLDPTRKELLWRAMKAYAKAIAFTEQHHENLEAFLKTTKLDLPKYKTLRATTDKKYPGVVIVHLGSPEDILQFEQDVELESRKKLRVIAKKLGATVEEGPHGSGGWAGRSVRHEEIGLDKDHPVLGVIAVDDNQQPEEIEGVLAHEYAHAQYQKILKPFVHHYISGTTARTDAEFLQRHSTFSRGTREKIEHALGDTMTYSYRREKDAPEKGDKDSEFAWLMSALDMATQTKYEKIHSERRKTLSEEQSLLNELRAYGYNHPILPPNVAYSAQMHMKKPEHPGQLNVIDPEMAARFLKVHALVFKAHLIDSNIHLRALCALGMAQTLDQAQRLLVAITDKGAASPITSQENFEQMASYIAAYANDEFRGQFRYQIGETAIPKDEIVKMLLPPQEVFDNAVETLYDNTTPPESVMYMRGLYKKA